MIRHSSVVVLLHWLRENVTDEERSSVLFSTSINFDVSVAEIFGTLAWGGKLVLAENALELATLDEEVVHVSMVPSAAAELLRSGGIPACVKTLNLGGEALPNALAQGLYALETVEKVGNLYGPTEDTTYSTYSLVPRGADQVLVGTPVANTQAYVLDRASPARADRRRGRAVPRRATGCRAATRIVPRMTAERFVPCPFGRAGRADVPGDGPRALARGRRDRVPGPHRLPGEGARLPHRAGRDRGAARRAPGRARPRRPGARGRARRPAAGRVLPGATSRSRWTR